MQNMHNIYSICILKKKTYNTRPFVQNHRYCVLNKNTITTLSAYAVMM